MEVDLAGWSGPPDPVVLGRSPGTTRKGEPTSDEAVGPNRSGWSSPAAGDMAGKEFESAVETEVTVERSRVGEGVSGR